MDFIEWIKSKIPDSLGADQVVSTDEAPEVPQVAVNVPQNYDQVSNANYGPSRFASSEPPARPLPQPTYYNSAGLKSDINGNAIMNSDGTYTDREGHTIMSDKNGNAIMPADAPEYYSSWYQPPKKFGPPDDLGADQVISNAPVTPSQEPFPSPKDWLAHKRAVKQAEAEYNARQQNPQPFAVAEQIPEVATPSQQDFPSPKEWLAQKRAADNGITWDNSADLLVEAGKKLTQPAATALEAISYLDKPRGAIAGGVKAATEGQDIVEGVKKGWKDNTSWGEMLPDQFKKEHPTASAITGFVGDVLLDPAWLLPPAKIAKGIAAGSKAVGLTDNIINPAVKAVKESETGQKWIARAEDWSGKNRLADEQFDFNAARAKDQVEGQDYVDAVKGLKKQYGDDADKLTDYIQARERPKNTALNNDGSSESSLEKQREDMINDTINFYKDNPGGQGVTQGNLMRNADGEVIGRFGRQSNNPQWYQDFWKEYGHAPTQKTLREFAEKELSKYPDSGYDELMKEINRTKQHINSLGNTEKITVIIDDVKTGKAPEMIRTGLYTREDVYNALRDKGEEIPDYILQDAQRYAKEAGQQIPDTVYRDQVLQSIPNEGLRKAIQSIGDKFIDLNKKYSDNLRSTGRLSDEQYVKFMDGEHLRRSFSQYENPEKFLEAVRKNGTPEEYRRVYQSLANSKAPGAQGYSQAHRVQMKDFVGRQNLSEETMKKLGLITDPEYRIMDTINRSSKSLREDEFLDRIATLWGKTADEAADLSRTLPERRQYVPIPDTKGYGTLAGKWVPRDIADQVLKTTGTKPDNINKTWQKMVSWWKVEKLASPASTLRNFYSGLPMANAFGKVPFQALPKYMSKVTLAYKSQGKNHPLLRELRETGILGNEWSRQELQNIIGENPKGITKLAKWGMNAFGAPDKFWRSVVYAYHRDKGKSAKQAAQIANRALLDYSQVPEWVNTASKTGVAPFIKFPLLAGAETAKSLYNNPAQITKYTKAQNQASNEDREKLMPDYMKAKTLLPLWDSTRTVNGKPQPVQNNLDLSYILPFASDVSLGNPIYDAIQLARTGKNGLGMDVIKPGMTAEDKVKAWGKYLYNSFGPSFPLPGNYAGDKLVDGFQGNVDAKGRQYDPWSATSQVLLGAKNVPINTDELANQKMKNIEFQMKSTMAMMNQIAKDKSLNKEQKMERIKDHQKQYKELQKQLKEISQAYTREKQRGAQ